MVYYTCLSRVGGGVGKPMDLPNLFAVDTTQAATKLCALVVTDTTVQAALLSISVEGVVVAAQSNIVPYSNAKSIVYSADVAFQDLGKASEDVNEVVFILEESWLDADGSVDAAHQPLIEQLRKELLLNPVGFVVQQEAIADYLLLKRPQLSSILLLWQSQSVSANWIEHGSVITSVQQERTTSPQTDVAQLVERLQQADPQRPLPSNVICTSLSLAAPTVTQLQQKLLDMTWSSLGMTAQPSIEVLTTQLSTRVVFEAAGQAMREVLDTKHAAHAVGGSIKDAEEFPATEEATEIDSSAELPDQEDIDAVDDDGETLDPHDNLAPAPDLADDGSLPAGSPPPTSFGIPVRQRYETAVDDSLLPQNRGKLPGMASPVEFDEPELEEVSERTQKKSFRLSKKILLIGGIVLGLLLVSIAAVATLVLGRKAIIIVEPTTQIVAEDVSLTLSATEESDAATRTLHATEVTAEVSGDSSTATTGVKLVGEKAKGEVTVINKTSEEKVLPAGTALSTNSLKYTLDDEVSIPAAKENDNKKGMTYGEANSKITAAEIGVDSNVAEKTNFQVASFSSSEFEAEAVTEISGGSSREVKVASESDRNLLLAELKKELTQQAEEKIRSELGEGQQVVMNSAITVVSTQYSAEVGAEADSVELTLTVAAKGLAYSKIDVKPIADAILESKVPEGYSIQNSVPEILSAASAGATGNVVEANISVKAAAVVDPAAVAASAANQRESVALDTIKGLPGVANATIQFQPSLVRYLMPTLPSSKNISVVTQIVE